MSREVDWSTSFRIAGAFSDLEGLCTSFVNGEIFDLTSFETVSGLKANRLALQVGGRQNLLDGLIFLKLIRRENHLLFADRFGSVMADEKGIDDLTTLRFSRFAENAIECLYDSDEAWKKFVDRVKFRGERVLFPAGAEFIFLRDVLIGSEFIENESGNWVGLERSPVILEAASIRKSRARLALRKKITQKELEERIRKQAEIGELGERLVMRYENNRLLSIGHEQKCNHVSQVDCGAGYDIESYNECTSKTINRFLEVKSTTGFRNSMTVFLSRNEFETAVVLGPLYSLMLVRIGEKTARVVEIPSPIERLGLQDLCWRPGSDIKFESLSIHIDLNLLRQREVEIDLI